MFAAIFALNIIGGYNKVDMDEDIIVSARGFMRENLGLFFPEFARTNILFHVVDAEMQVVAGYNIIITFRLGNEEYKVKLYYPPGKMTPIVNNIVSTSESSLGGGWRFHDPQEFSSEHANSVLNTLKHEQNLDVSIKHLVMARTQIVSGMNTHIVFYDDNGVLHSVTTYRRPNGLSSITQYNTLK